MHPSGKYFITDQYTLSPNQVMTMVATCGHTVTVHLARQLGATHVQEAINMAAYRGHAHIMRLCHHHDKVEIDEVIVCAVEGGHEEVVRLCSRIGSHRSRQHHAPVS